MPQRRKLQPRRPSNNGQSVTSYRLTSKRFCEIHPPVKLCMVFEQKHLEHKHIMEEAKEWNLFKNFPRCDWSAEWLTDSFAAYLEAFTCQQRGVWVWFKQWNNRINIHSSAWSTTKQRGSKPQNKASWESSKKEVITLCLNKPLALGPYSLRLLFHQQLQH